MNYTFNFVMQLGSELKERLKDHRFAGAFSSGRDELFLNFEKPGSRFGIRLLWAARNCFLFFNEHDFFEKPVPYHVQFAALNGLHITNLRQHLNNRSLEIKLGNDNLLVFKLYNGLANVLHFQGAKLVSHFRSSIEKDALLTPAMFDRIEPYQSKGVELDSIPVIPSLNRVNTDFLTVYTFEEKKHQLIQSARTEHKRLSQTAAKAGAALQQLQQEVSPEEIGHIIMANMHAIKQGDTEVKLFDFYRNSDLVIRMKKDLSPQENAALYYRKGKNRKQELDQIEKRVAEAQSKIPSLERRIADIEACTTLKELKPFPPAAAEANKPREDLFREFEMDGFRILVGKSSANNDLLTMKHAHKNDLWLHARGAGGSHVVVKQQAGKPFSKAVIERAASLAAHYSKLKGSALVPVIYTLRKFVRKPKGADPGSVLVEKEEVILVPPAIMS